MITNDNVKTRHILISAEFKDDTVSGKDQYLMKFISSRFFYIVIIILIIMMMVVTIMIIIIIS